MKSQMFLPVLLQVFVAVTSLPGLSSASPLDANGGSIQADQDRGGGGGGFPNGALSTYQLPITRMTLKVPHSLEKVRSNLWTAVGSADGTPISLKEYRDAVAQGKPAFEAYINSHKGPSGFLLFQSLFHGNWFKLYGYENSNKAVSQNMTTLVIGNPLYLKELAKHVESGYGPFLVRPDRVLMYDEGKKNECFLVWDKLTTNTGTKGAKDNKEVTRQLEDQERKWEAMLHKAAFE